jgi:murein DD-endopeptidase MepM/ murein hydrolase activator NlpD
MIEDNSCAGADSSNSDKNSHKNSQAFVWTLVFVAAFTALHTGRQGPFLAEARGNQTSTGQEKLAVKVITKQVGDATHFSVENRELCEVTMTFDFASSNLRSDRPLPYTATFLPGKTEAFTLSPVTNGSAWKYAYTNYYKLGSNCAHHDDSCEYQLPYKSGSRFTISQGYNGPFSHQGPNQYALDWQMPEGTPVCAARAGLVVNVKQDSDTGGSSMDFDQFNNYITIRHDDGTLGHYCHLRKNGCCVKVGQRVNAGDRIASSGNTGYSSGPHLHFCVFRTKNGRERESIPVRFRTFDAQGVTLTSGRTYRAA